MTASKRFLIQAALILFCVLLVLSVCISAFSAYSYNRTKQVFYLAIEKNDVDAIRNYLAEKPSLANTTRNPVFAFVMYPFMGEGGSSALTLAIRCNTGLETVKLLVESGADVNKHPFCNGDDYPLLLALRFGDLALASYLIEQGADLHVTTESESAPFCLLYHKAADEATYELQYELFMAMMAQEVSLKAPEQASVPLLHLALKHTDILAYLLTSQAAEIDVNAVNPLQMTALSCAVQAQNYEACALLLAHGADVKPKDSEGRTALDHAVALGDQTLIDMLKQ